MDKCPQCGIPHSPHIYCAEAKRRAGYSWGMGWGADMSRMGKAANGFPVCSLCSYGHSQFTSCGQAADERIAQMSDAERAARIDAAWRDVVIEARQRDQSLHRLEIALAEMARKVNLAAALGRKEVE